MMTACPHNVYGQALGPEHLSSARVLLSHRSAHKLFVRELAEYLEYLQVGDWIIVTVEARRYDGRWLRRRTGRRVTQPERRPRVY